MLYYHAGAVMQLIIWPSWWMTQAQNITHVVRGADLLSATPIHALLQHLLNYPTPIYHHHALIRDTDGKRLAKRDDAKAIAKFRDEGASADDIRVMVGLPPRSKL
jgi:glutamyl-Q tRNA(Asp) synthetase